MFRRIRFNYALFAAVTISFIYILINSIWIFCSDKLINIFSGDLNNISQMQILYIFFSGLLFFVFACISLKPYYKTKEKLNGTYSALTKIEKENKTLKEKLQKIKNSSPISGLPNKRALKKSLDIEIKNCIKTGLKGALYFIDLDNFKSVNDAHGHLNY